MTVSDNVFVVSFAGLGKGKTHANTLDATFVLDAQRGRWTQAKPDPGRAVFGHAGGIVGNRIVYCDGVAIQANPDKRRNFIANDECLTGVIDRDDGRRIDWRHIAPHPGPPRYGMAAAGIVGQNAVLFIGGSENPYNYDGIGYNGEPSKPAAGAVWFDLDAGRWREIQPDTAPSMDHRGLVPLGAGWLTVGGMLDGQEVTNRVVAYTLF